MTKGAIIKVVILEIVYGFLALFFLTTSPAFILVKVAPGYTYSKTQSMLVFHIVAFLVLYFFNVILWRFYKKWNVNLRAVKWMYWLNFGYAIFVNFPLFLLFIDFLI